MILGSLIVVISILALAGMSFPVVRAVSDPNDRKQERLLAAREKEKAAEKVIAAAAAEAKRKGLKEVKDKGLRERRLRLKKQCSLMANIDTINKHAKNHPRTPTNYMILESKEPYDVISKLFLPRDKDGSIIGPDTLFELTSDEISSLVPKVRIFKTVYPKGSEGDPKSGINVELPFSDHTDPNNILNITKRAKGKAGAVGLKSFEWTSLGTNPANVNIFEANMTLFFQSIEEMFEKKMEYPKEAVVSQKMRDKGIRFADLLVQQAKFKERESGEPEFNEGYFRLKAVVGWASPVGQKWKGKRGTKLKKLLDRMSVSMSLSLQSHELDFRENGSLEVKIKYVTSIDGIMNGPNSNILFQKDAELNGKMVETKNKLKQKKAEYAEIAGDEIDKEKTPDPQTSTVDEATKESLEKLEEEIKELQGAVDAHKVIEKNFKYGRFMKQLLAKNVVNSLLVPSDPIKKIVGHTLNQDEKFNKGKPGDIKISSYKKQQERSRSLNTSCARVAPGTDSASQEQEDQPGIVDDLGRYRDAVVEVFKEAFVVNQDIETVEQVKNYVNANEHIVQSILKYGDDYGDGGAYRQLMADFKHNFDLNDLGNAKDTAAEEKKKLQQIISVFNNLNKEEIVAPGTDDSCGDRFFQISYIKLGDLVDVALDTLFQGDDRFANKGFAEKRVKVLLGTFTYNDYGEEPDGGRAGNRVVKDDDGTIIKLLTGKEKTMNLADVPISLETFSRWFNKSVVAPGKETYLISNFIRDVITDLIPMSLGQECYEYAPKQKIRFTMLPMTINSPNGNFFKDVGTTRANIDDIAFPKQKDYYDGQQTEDLLYIYAETESPYRLTGDYEEDRKKGIPHFYWGADTGFVKNISFSREDQPYLRESNIKRAVDDGSVGVGKILREKYNAAISLFGNTLYYPGQKVYVNPSVQTLGKSTNVDSKIRELGFGGYYDIVKVSSVIEPGVFETKLETKWQCFGDGKFNDGEPVEDLKPTHIRTS